MSTTPYQNPNLRANCFGYVKLSLSLSQLRLLHTEMSTNASCCDDEKLAREYRALERKFFRALLANR